jgi:hypothetical protein
MTSAKFARGAHTFLSTFGHVDEQITLGMAYREAPSALYCVKDDSIGTALSFICKSAVRFE